MGRDKKGGQRRYEKFWLFQMMPESLEQSVKCCAGSERFSETGFGAICVRIRAGPGASRGIDDLAGLVVY